VAFASTSPERGPVARMSVLDNVSWGTMHRSHGAGTARIAFGWGCLLGATSTPRGERALAHPGRRWLRSVADACAPACRSPPRNAWAGARVVSQPRLLMLDEPAGGLNHTEVRELGR